MHRQFHHPSRVSSLQLEHQAFKIRLELLKYHQRNASYLKSALMSQDTLYQSLDESRSEIRLLEIISGSPGAPVECKLSTVSLLETPNFAALSYVWGDPKVTDDIQVDGHTLSVTVNLAAALKYVKEHWIKHVPDKIQLPFEFGRMQFASTNLTLVKEVVRSS